MHSATQGKTADTTFLTSSLVGVILQNRMRFWSQSLDILDSMKVGSDKFALHYDGELLPDTLFYPTSLLKRWDARTTTHHLYRRDYAGIFDTVFARTYDTDSLGRITTEQRPNGYQNGYIFDLRKFGYTATGALSWYRQSHTQNRNCVPDYGCTFGGETIDQTYGYGYDPVSNLTSQVDSTNGNATTSGTFAAGNRLTGWGGMSYTYDEDGNRLTRSDGRTYTWSATGRLRKVTYGSSSVEYAYNAFGELVRRKTNGVVDRHFVWDGEQLLLLLDGSGYRVAEYAYLPNGEPVMMRTANQTAYYHTDGRGNVTGMSTGTSILQHRVYGPWGDVELQTGMSLDTTRLGWKGYMYESGIVGLYYARNRWYDPGSRGFISEDPLGISGGLNTTAFVGNDPVNGWDPDGLKAQGCTYLMTTRGSESGRLQEQHYEIGTCSGGGPIIFLPPLIAAGPVYPSETPSRTPSGSGGGGRSAGVKAAFSWVWSKLTSECGQATASLLVTAAGDATILAGGWEVKAALTSSWKLGVRAAEAGAVGGYKWNRIARLLTASAQSQLLIAHAAATETFRASGQLARDAAGFAASDWMDYFPILDLKNPLRNAYNACF